MSAKKTKQNIEIKNKRASFEYEFLDVFIAGIQLFGTEIKSIRAGQANITDSYCFLINNEIFVKNLHISEYINGTYNNHLPLRERKLLLKRNEIKKLEVKLKDVGLTLIPTRLFISENGYAKLEIVLAKGKKSFDKRESIKEKDVQREIDRKFRV